MRVLIVQSNEPLGTIWLRHLERLGCTVMLALNGNDAVDLIENQTFDVIVLDLVLGEGNALTVGDIACFRQPDANIVYVTDTTFFSDGSIFRHSPNARAFIESNTPPQDLAAIVHHYGERTTPEDEVRERPAQG